jgi:hypothetical protein
MEKYGGKTYSPIKKPETANYQERIDMGKRFLPNRCKEPKGYYIDKRHDEENGGVRKGYTATGYPYMEYILVQNGHRSWYIDDGG